MFHIIRHLVLNTKDLFYQILVKEIYKNYQYKYKYYYASVRTPNGYM